MGTGQSRKALSEFRSTFFNFRAVPKAGSDRNRDFENLDSQLRANSSRFMPQPAGLLPSSVILAPEISNSVAHLRDGPSGDENRHRHCRHYLKTRLANQMHLRNVRPKPPASLKKMIPHENLRTRNKNRTALKLAVLLFSRKEGGGWPIPFSTLLGARTRRNDGNQVLQYAFKHHRDISAG